MATTVSRTPYTLHAHCARKNTILTLSTSSRYSPLWDNLNTDNRKGTGVVVFQTSAGMQGFKKAARGEFEAASQTVAAMFREIKALAYKTDIGRPLAVSAPKEATASDLPPEPPSVVLARKKKSKYGISPITDLSIALDGFGQGRDALYSALTSETGLQVKKLVKHITDVTPVAIGGPKPKKARRL